MIALDPQQTFEVAFDIDAAKPAAEKRVLVCRYPTARQRLRMLQLTTQANEQGPNLQKEIELHCESLGVVALEWRGGGKDAKTFSAETAPDELSLEELREASVKAIYEARITEMEKKESALRSQSSAAAGSSTETASPAPTGNA